MTLVDELARHWWVMAVRGLAAVVFGLLAFAWPGMTLAVLVLLFGAYALVDGVLAIVVALRGGTDHRLFMGLEGVVGVLAGLAAFVFPGLTALVLLYIIAFWAVLTGVLEVVAAVRLRRVISNEWGLIIGGVLSVLFGIVLIVVAGCGSAGCGVPDRRLRRPVRGHLADAVVATAKPRARPARGRSEGPAGGDCLSLSVV